ncbi:MAG: DUF1311 domain-containing protein [Candidatus Odyssella sp.]|nr:DUF1311 domain-containing protein [Candidatus Odyssella sp.]
MRGIASAAALAIVLWTQAASAQNDRPRPSFDCAGVDGRVQMTICNSQDLSELDRDLARYVLALKTTLSDDAVRALDASQTAWENARDRQCNRVIGEIDPDGPVYRCLLGMYRNRLVQLAQQNERQRAERGRAISGYYRFVERGVSGEMWIIAWPESIVTVLIDTLTLPDAPTCAFRMETTDGGRDIDGFAQHAPECRVAISLEGRAASVASSNCAAVCVLNGRIDGVYRR